MNRLITFAKKIHDDSLYRNAIYLMASMFVMAGIGFFFWVICARLYSAEEIGLATTLISLTTLITNFSMFGLNTAVIRFLPTSKSKNELINTAITVISIGTIVVTLIVLAGLPWISPRLEFIRNYPLFTVAFLVFMIVSSLNTFTDSIFIAYRRTEFVLIYDTVMSLVKLITPIFLVDLGMYGIFYGYISSISVALILSFVFLIAVFSYRFQPRIYLEQVKKMWKFSFGMYSSGVLGILSLSITPILITNILGPVTTAYYYMPNMISQLILSIPRSFGQSVFAEGSNESQNHRLLFFKTLRSNYIVLLPLIIITILAGPTILRIFGKQYSTEGSAYLNIILIAILISVPNYIFQSIMNVRKMIHEIFILTVISTIISIGFLILGLQYGLIGVGLSSVATQTVLLMMYLIISKNIL